MGKDDLLVIGAALAILLVLGTICTLATVLGVWFWVLLILAALGAAIGGGGYVIRVQTRPAKRGERAYAHRDYGHALRFYTQAGDAKMVRECLLKYLPHWENAPSKEVESTITQPLVEATLLLMQLQRAIALARKHSVSETLLRGHKSYEQNTQAALNGSLDTADKVAGFIKTGYDYKNVRESLQREGRSLKEIAAACELAQSALAELTISSHSSEALKRAEEGLSALSKAVMDKDERDKWRKLSDVSDVEVTDLDKTKQDQTRDENGGC